MQEKGGASTCATKIQGQPPAAMAQPCAATQNHILLQMAVLLGQKECCPPLCTNSGSDKGQVDNNKRKEESMHVRQ
jgi:predicted secreted protein